MFIFYVNPEIRSSVGFVGAIRAINFWGFATLSHVNEHVKALPELFPAFETGIGT